MLYVLCAVESNYTKKMLDNFFVCAKEFRMSCCIQNRIDWNCNNCHICFVEITASMTAANTNYTSDIV